VPANVTALVLRARPGERKCTAGNHEFPVAGRKVKMGVLTHYAALALEDADTAGAWLKKTQALAERDARQGRLPAGRCPSLGLTGDPGRRLFPGRRQAGVWNPDGGPAEVAKGPPGGQAV
jgi:hypothetical protein